MYSQDQGGFDAPFATKQKLARALVANSAELMNEEPILLDLQHKLLLREKFGFSAHEIDEMPSNKVDTYLFLIDTLNKKQQLGVVN